MPHSKSTIDLAYRTALLWLLLMAVASGQGVVLLRTPGTGAYDLTKDPGTPNRLVSLPAANKGAANAAAFETAMSHIGEVVGIGASSTNGVCAPIYLPAKPFECDGFTMPARNGGAIIGGGGHSPAWPLQYLGSAQGASTTIIKSGVSTSTPCITYKGQGWYLGPMDLVGFRMDLQADYETRFIHDKADYAVKVVNDGVLGVNAGKITVDLGFTGFTDCIYFANSPQSTNGNFRAPFLQADNCNTLLHSVSPQAVRFLVDDFVTGTNVQRVFYFERGGMLTCLSGTIEGTCNNTDPSHADDIGTTVLELGNDSTSISDNEGRFVIYDLKIDNFATNFRLVKLHSHTVPLTVVITGHVGSDVTFTAADLLIGEAAGDKIYFKFTGDATKAAAINGADTETANPLAALQRWESQRGQGFYAAIRQHKPGIQGLIEYCFATAP